MPTRFAPCIVVALILLSVCHGSPDAARQSRSAPPDRGLSGEQIEFVEKAFGRLRDSRREMALMRPAPAMAEARGPQPGARPQPATSGAGGWEFINARGESLAALYSELRAAQEVPWEKWVELTTGITEAAADCNVRSEVIISTPRDGAQIRYQLVGDRIAGKAPTMVSQPTTCVEKMLIGHYHIWAERRGKPTSSKTDVFRVLDEKVRIRISEHAR